MILEVAIEVLKELLKKQRRMKNAKHEQLPDLRKPCPRS